MFQYDSQNTGSRSTTKSPAESVNELWTFDINQHVTDRPESRIQSSPVAGKTGLFFGTNVGQIYGIERADGAERWGKSLDNLLFLPSPIIVDGLLLIGTNRSLTAYDVSDGAVHWGFDIDSPSVGNLQAQAVVNNGNVYFGALNGVAYSLRLDDGTKRWQNELESAETGVIQSTPCVVNDRVVFASSVVDQNTSYVTALSKNDGSVEWRQEITGKRTSSLTLSKDALYITSETRDPPTKRGKLYRVTPEDGTIEWTYETDEGIASTPAVADERVFVGSLDEGVYGIDATSGEEEWRFATNDTVVSSPAVSDSTVYIGSTDQHLYALDTKTGEPRWQFETDGAISTCPVLADDILYVGTQGGTIYALKEP